MIKEKKTINNIRSIDNKSCRFLSFRGINPWFINVKNVKIPKNTHRNEERIIQLKFLIILNILNNR